MTDLTQSSSGLIKAVVVAVILVILAAVSPQLVENLDSKDILVIQSLSGQLEVYTEPGPKWQMFGKATTYPRRKQYSFCSTVDPATGTEYRCPGADADGKRVRFSEGGHGIINGAVSWEMPMKPVEIKEVHMKFGSEEAIEQAAVSKMIDSAIYFSGPMMSSTESSGPRRGELVQYINDQATHGIYVTESKQEVVKDPAGQNQTVTVTHIIRDKTGQPQRQQGSILEEFKITLMPISINELKYDKVVEKQIADRQASITAVQNSIAAATMADQAAKTAESNGKADAAKARWAQETIKATAVTKAQQDYEVSVFGAKQAEQYKRKMILEGEGDAAKARLVMQANGALEDKLAAYKEVNKNYADAIAKYQGNWVPTTYMGGGAGGHSNGAADLIQMLSAKTARELSLDMSMKK